MNDLPEGRSDAVVVVLTTAPDLAVAESLATHVVEERLGACVNVLPGVTSIYRWEDGLQRDTELLLLIKTTAGSVRALRDRIVDLHPYDVPEVLALPIAEGHGPYVDWICDSVGHAR